MKKETDILAERVDASLFWQIFSFRVGLLDRRSLRPWVPDNAHTNLLMGIYHIPTASRLLYGVLDEWGLPARIKNPWVRTAPFAENHAPTVSDIKIEPSSKNPSSYLYLKSTKIGIFSGFASVSLDNDSNAAFGGGVSADFRDKKTFRLEGFYTDKELPPRTASTWFSKEPPLPPREFRIFGVGTVFSSPLFILAMDFANSETFAFGHGIYANIGVRFGGKTSRASLPWAVSFAGDGVSERYVGRDGAEPGGGFRYAAKFEYFGKNNALFRIGTNIRAGHFGGDFERGSGEFYYRFPVFRNAPVQFSRVSFNLTRNASKVPILDDYEAIAGLNLWKFRTFFSISLSSLSWSQAPFPYPLIDAASKWKSIKLSGDVSYRLRLFLLSAKTGYLIQDEKKSLWNLSLSSSLYRKHSRFTFKVSSEDLVQNFENWFMTVSWRISL